MTSDLWNKSSDGDDDGGNHNHDGDGHSVENDAHARAQISPSEYVSFVFDHPAYLEPKRHEHVVL